MEAKEKSIQELENDYWPDLDDYPSGLIQRCHDYRKIKLNDLQIHQIITLLIQDIGSEYLMPMVLERMDKNIFEEDDYDGSSFLQSIEFLNKDIFRRSPQLLRAFLELLQRKESEIESLLGSKQHERKKRRIEEKFN